MYLRICLSHEVGWITRRNYLREIILGLYEKIQLLQYVKILRIENDTFSRSVVTNGRIKSSFWLEIREVNILPGIHPTINYGVVHAVGHCQPIYAQKDLLDVRFICNLWQIWRHYEVHMKRKPAHCEYYYYDYHHFYDLKYKENLYQSRYIRPVVSVKESKDTAFSIFKKNF